MRGSQSLAHEWQPSSSRAARQPELRLSPQQHHDVYEFRFDAKEAARLALMMAIGDLQKHAGPDQRVTARAEILGDSNVLPETKNWTGVWDTTDTTAEPHWLVSGNLSDPSNLSVNQSTLYRPASNATNPDDIVTVPYQQTDASGNRTTISSPRVGRNF